MKTIRTTTSEETYAQTWHQTRNAFGQTGWRPCDAIGDDAKTGRSVRVIRARLVVGSLQDEEVRIAALLEGRDA